MKKTYLLLPIFFLASCSSSDDDIEAALNNGNNNNNNNNTPVLVTKMVADGDVSTYTYNGTKLSESKNLTDGTVTTFFYTGDLITKSVTSGSNSTYTTTYTYDGSSRLSKKATVHTATNLSSTTEIIYTYPSPNNVKMVVTLSTGGSSVTKAYTRNAILNADGSIKNWTETVTSPLPSGGFDTGNGILQPIVYDTKNAPFKNVTGYLKLMDQEDENGSAHNVTDYKNVIQYSISTGTEWTIFSSIYVYNASGYPIKDTRKYYDKTGSSVTNTEVTTYEYNHL
ncbi:hypothetical protein MP478_18175 [Chryseobacterium sp. WG14]|uniref:hypothetical protein n=1 Tax=Chryseobacterium sp. WG14 TaxID=2926909 RepID=UPI00211E86E3|nr:hypothetical protein [Chryseobacterium sp. WG14]MCQ9641312.1 hypothetical protein [Chryseobacterium sp. WG14]